MPFPISGNYDKKWKGAYFIILDRTLTPKMIPYYNNILIRYNNRKIINQTNLFLICSAFFLSKCLFNNGVYQNMIYV